MFYCNKGQVRIIEALLTCLIILVGLSVSVYFGGVYESAEPGKLKKVGENILNVLDDQEVIEDVVFGSGVTSELKALIESLLPPDTFYSVRISSALDNRTIAELTNIINQNFSSVFDAVTLQQIEPVSLPIIRKGLAKLDVMLVIDRSTSMNEKEPGDPHTKIYYAKNAAKTFVDQLNATKDTVGLTSFGTSASLDQDLTTNFNSVKSKIDALYAPSNQYTCIGGGIEVAKNAINSSRRSDTITALILLSDGLANVDENGKQYEPYGNATQRAPAIAYAEREAEEAGDMDIRIYTIGLGADTTSFDEDLLKDIVKNGGQYYYAPSGQVLEDIYESIALDLLYQVQYDIVVIELTLVKAK